MSHTLQRLFERSARFHNHRVTVEVRMVHCPECDATIEAESDVEFVDLDAKIAGIFRSSKRFYVVACTGCGAAIGSGVAGGGG
jgi:hypothetical protein